MKTTLNHGLRDGSGSAAPVSSGDRPLGVERVKERFIAPTSAPSTGEVRLQVADAADMTQTADNGQGPFGVRSWSPPV